MVKAERKGGGRFVDKLEIQRIEQLHYVSRGGRDGWLVASRMNYASPRRNVDIRRAYEKEIFDRILVHEQGILRWNKEL